MSSTEWVSHFCGQLFPQLFLFLEASSLSHSFYYDSTQASSDVLHHDMTTGAGSFTWHQVRHGVPHTWRWKRQSSCSALQINLPLQVKQKASRCLNPLQRGPLNSSPYLAPRLESEECSVLCVGRTRVGAIPPVVGPAAGWTTGANKLLDGQSATMCVLSPVWWRRSGGIRATVGEAEETESETVNWWRALVRWFKECENNNRYRALAHYPIIQVNGLEYIQKDPPPKKKNKKKHHELCRGLGSWRKSCKATHLKLWNIPTHSSQVTPVCPLMTHSGWDEIGNCCPPPLGGPSEA